jgi:hypothetical protein
LFCQKHLEIYPFLLGFPIYLNMDFQSVPLWHSELHCYLLVIVSFSSPIFINLCLLLSFYFYLPFFLWYWGSTGPTPWATSPAPILCDGSFEIGSQQLFS